MNDRMQVHPNPPRSIDPLVTSSARARRLRRAHALGVAAAALAALGLASCGGVTVSEMERQGLADYEQAAADTVRALDGLGQTSATLAMRAESEASDAMIDDAIDAQAARLSELEDAVGALQSAEELLQRSAYGPEPGVRREGLAAAALFVLTAAALAVTMRALSDAMLERRPRRDAALVDGDVAAYEEEQREINRLGVQAAETLVTKVVPNPVERAIGLVPGGELALTLRGTAQDLTTLTATDACRVDPDSDDCRLGATTGDSSMPVEVPAGTLQVVVTGPGLARTVVDDVSVAEGERVTVEIDLVEYDELPAEGASGVESCRGTYTDTGAHFCFDSTSGYDTLEDFRTECTVSGFPGTVHSGPC